MEDSQQESGGRADESNEQRVSISRIRDLEQENQTLRERLSALEAELSGEARDPATDTSDSNGSSSDDSGALPISRRGVMALTGAGLLGGMASGGASATGSSSTMATTLDFGDEVQGQPSSSKGLQLKNTAPTGFQFGVVGRAESPDGVGVAGYADGASGSNEGVYGRSFSSKGSGVKGYSAVGSGSPTGVEGVVDTQAGTAVFGYNKAGSGNSIGIEGKVDSSSGYGLFTRDDSKVGGTLEVGGDLQVTGTKNFVQAVQTTQGPKQVTYTAVEAGNVRTETSDVAKMEDGKAVVGLPTHFEMVTSDERDLSVQVTPHAAEPAHPQVTERSTDRIVVEDFGDGASDYSFSYTVKGIREGFEDQQIVTDRR